MTATDRRADRRAAYIKGMRALMDTLEANPDVPLPWQGTSSSPMTFHYLTGENPRRDMALAARAIPCKWAKSEQESQDGRLAWLNLDGLLHGLHIQLDAYRDAVCERVVTGTEEREVEKVITPAVTEKVTESVPVVEWRCGSIMAALDESEVPA
jgi:hypothetical protein